VRADLPLRTAFDAGGILYACVTRTAGIGASSLLQFAPAKVGLLNPQRALVPDRGNWSLCPQFAGFPGYGDSFRAECRASAAALWHSRSRRLSARVSDTDALQNAIFAIAMPRSSRRVMARA
jgi:hypothetical protein